MVDPEVWAFGHVLAYRQPLTDDVTYAHMNALCERLHALEPAVKFDNRAWLGKIHYLLYLGDHDKAVAALTQAAVLRDADWHVCAPGKISLPQYCSTSWQEAQPAAPLHATETAWCTKV